MRLHFFFHFHFYRSLYAKKRTETRGTNFIRCNPKKNRSYLILPKTTLERRKKIAILILSFQKNFLSYFTEFDVMSKGIRLVSCLYFVSD